MDTQEKISLFQQLAEEAMASGNESEADALNSLLVAYMRRLPSDNLPANMREQWASYCVPLAEMRDVQRDCYLKQIAGFLRFCKTSDVVGACFMLFRQDAVSYFRYSDIPPNFASGLRDLADQIDEMLGEDQSGTEERP